VAESTSDIPNFSLDLRSSVTMPDAQVAPTNVGCSPKAHTKPIYSHIFPIKANILAIKMRLTPSCFL
jgi:hypothetical protein